MTIYEDLRKDHDQVKKVLAKLSGAETAEERRNLIAQVRDLLVPHSRAEEAVFYNVLRDLDEAKDLVLHSYEEHIKAESLLRGLQVTEAVALNWQSGVKMLIEDLTHHIAEEEGKVFSAAKKVLSEEEATMLGKAFREMKPKLGAGLLSSQLDLIANIMPQRLRKSFVDRLKPGEHKKAS